jgi:hypothetical protein
MYQTNVAYTNKAAAMTATQKNTVQLDKAEEWGT